MDWLSLMYLSLFPNQSPGLLDMAIWTLRVLLLDWCANHAKIRITRPHFLSLVNLPIFLEPNPSSFGWTFQEKITSNLLSLSLKHPFKKKTKNPLPKHQQKLLMEYLERNHRILGGLETTLTY